MKIKPFLSSKDKSKKLKCRLRQFLFCALRVNIKHFRKIVEKMTSMLYHIENSKTCGQTM